MKKIFLLLSVVTFGLSCTQTKQETVQSTIFLEQKLTEFINDHPNWTKDEATEAETTDQFKRKLIHLSNEAAFLNQMPLQLKKIVDTTENGQAVKVAHFMAYNDNNRPEGSLLNYIQLHINGIINDEQVNRLKIDQKYTLTGSLQRQGKRADVKFIKVSDFKGYDLGKYTFLITDFKPL